MPVADGIASKPYTLNMLNPLCTHRESWSLFSDLYVSICACLSRQSLSSALFSDLYCTLTADSDDFYHVSLCFCKRTMSVITLFLPSAQPSLWGWATFPYIKCTTWAAVCMKRSNGSLRWFHYQIFVSEIINCGTMLAARCTIWMKSKVLNSLLRKSIQIFCITSGTYFAQFSVDVYCALADLNSVSNFDTICHIC
jgi:hypothetical protein